MHRPVASDHVVPEHVRPIHAKHDLRPLRTTRQGSACGQAQGRCRVESRAVGPGAPRCGPAGRWESRACWLGPMLPWSCHWTGPGSAQGPGGVCVWLREAPHPLPLEHCQFPLLPVGSSIGVHPREVGRPRAGRPAQLGPAATGQPVSSSSRRPGSGLTQRKCSPVLGDVCSLPVTASKVITPFP